MWGFFPTEVTFEVGFSKNLPSVICHGIKMGGVVMVVQGYRSKSPFIICIGGLK